jgi:predicted negative regulator of RcsB-dependent stress response
MSNVKKGLFAQALMMEIEKNPVKLAYYDYLALEYYLKNVSDCEKNIKKHISEFTDEQFKQYINLRLGVITVDQIK